ncbi:MAG: alpha/beta hydrolase [Clostridiales bacterium]|nr:alpha/beta hydrolase [Clostridiales bacterium]
MNPKKLKKDGYEISYNTYGDKNNECIVFLHPAFMDSTNFHKQVDVFSKNYFVITMDLIGHGLSQVKKTNEQIDKSSDHLSQILQIEGIKDTHLVGVSLGSLIIQHFAYLYPDKAKTMTIVGGYSIHKDNKAILKAQSKEQFKWIIMIIFAMDKFRRYIASVSVLSACERHVVYESTKRFQRSSFRVMQGMGKIFIRHDNESKIPLLLLCGESDLDIAKNALSTWHSNEPKSEYHQIKNAGHCINMDNPKAFNEIVARFVEKY